MKRKLIIFILLLAAVSGISLAGQCSDDDQQRFLQSVTHCWPLWAGNSAAGAVAVQQLIDTIPDSQKCYNSDDAAALAAITRFYRFEQKKGTAGMLVKRDALTDCSGTQPVLTADGLTIAQGEFYRQMRVALNGLAAQGYPLYANGQPTFDNIQQNKIGDCFLISAIGYIIRNNPAAITGIITRSDNGETAAGLPSAYNVQFPPSAKNGKTAVTVKLSPAEIAFYSSPATVSDGLWEPVIQKAVAQQLLKYYKGKAKIDRASVLWNLELNHSPAAWVQEIFSGRNVKVYELGAKAPVTAKIKREIRAALASEHIVQAMKDLRNPTPQYPGDHWYAILGMDEENDTLMIWNPWGDSRNGRKNGISDLAVSEFVANFAWLVVQE